ncbi:unnamed protein product [Closterium sp. NIES-53]
MIALCQEHRLEHRTKHIALRYFLGRELQQRGQLRLAYVATRANTADIFTKALPPGDYQRFSTVLGLLVLLFLTGLVTTCSPPLCLWGKFTHHFRQNFLRKHLEIVDSQPLLCQDFKQQQQRAEGVGSAALTFGGLSLDECMMAFFSPNARCSHPPAPPKFSPTATPPPASHAPLFYFQAATFSTAAVAAAAAAAASTTEFPFGHDAFPIAHASIAAALHRLLKRPRADCPGLGAEQLLLGERESPLVPRGVVRWGVVCSMERRRQSVAEQIQQQGASSGMQDEEGGLLDALLQEEHCQQQPGGVASRAQRMLWPRAGSESALPNDVLLGFWSKNPALTKLQPADWPRVGSESALPDDVLLGLCCEGSGFMQCSSLAAPLPTQPHTALPAPMPSQVAALHDPAPPRDMSSCITVTGSACATQEQEYLGACVDVLRSGSNTGNTDNNSDEALFLDTPLAHALAAPGAVGAAVPEWVVEQGGIGEGGAQLHRQ